MKKALLVVAAGLLAAAVVAALTSYAESAGRSRNWKPILEPTGVVPEPPPRVDTEVFTLLQEAFELAKETNCPVLVEVRCPKVKNVPSVEKMMEGGDAVSELLKNFVKLIIENVRELDLRMFPLDKYQDLDKTWWAWFMSPEGQIYSVFSGDDRAPVDKEFPSRSFAATMELVLKHHYDKERAKWNIDPKPQVLDSKEHTLQKLPGYKSWNEKHGKEVEDLYCLYCHSVANVYRQPLYDSGKFDKLTGFFNWPYPENTGVLTAYDDSLVVDSIIPGSPADKAGIKEGDRLGVANGRRLFSATDLRSSLCAITTGKPKLGLVVMRRGEPLTFELMLPKGWNKYDISWRTSVIGSGVGARPGFAWPLPAGDALRKKLGIPVGQMAIKPSFGPDTSKSEAFAAGLRANHVITAVNGKSPDLAGRPFLVWLLLEFNRGDELTLTVRDPSGKDSTIKYKTP